MSLTSRSLLATMISLALYGPAMANENNKLSEDVNDELALTSDNVDEIELVRGVCIAPQDRSTDPNNDPIKVTADHAEALDKTKVTYTGDVVVQQGNRTIAADQASLRQPENIVVAEGNVYFHDGTLEVDSERLQSDLDTEDSEMDHAVYNLTCEPGRGEARRITKTHAQGTQFYRMKDGTYTTCPTDDKSWRFSATTLEREGDSPFANLYNARFEVLDVPVFYLPYLRVPVGKERLTGFLYPSISYGSRDGFEFETPFYWNIAPNYDLTLTPKYMSNRGLQLNTDFRYLTEFGQGALKGEYLASDKAADAGNDGSRWAFNYSHNGTYKSNWLFEVDYSKTSDFSYFTDIDSSIGNREDNNLLQTAEVSYREQYWDSTLRVRDFQPLTETGQGSQYRLMPQLEFNYYRPNLPYELDFSMASSISSFANDATNKPDATRVHLEPTLTLPFATPWWSLTSEAKLLYTYYNQDLKSYSRDGIEETVSRTIPTARIHSGLYLERDTSIWGQDYTQSLEPQIQYLYVQDKDQSGIYNPVNDDGGGYDSTRLQQDYYGLFSDKTYSSVDYVAPANQFTVGASTRYFDNNFKERFTLSLGQIFYIDKPTVDDEVESYSATALETEFNYADWLFLKGSMQYDASDKEVQIANGAIEYRENGVYIQPNYRYVSSSYLDKYVTNPNSVNDSGDQDGISQLGLSTGFPLHGGISVRADYFHDLNVNKMVEGQVGLTYRSACWLIGLTYNKYASSSLGSSNTEYENNVSLTFSLLGLQGAKPFGASSDTGNTMTYGNSFSLNN